MDDMTRSQNIADRTAVGAPVNANGSSTRQDGEDINIADYLRVISRYRRMIFWICTITVITTAVISMLLPKMYAATVSVVPPIDILQKESSMAGGLGAVKSSVLRRAMDATSISDMYVGILQSRSVADACIIVPTVSPDTVTPHTESFQAIVWHLLVSHPRIKVAEMKWESVK